MFIPGNLHIDYFILDLLDDAVLVAVCVDLLQGYDRASEGSMGRVIETQENLPKSTLSQF